MVAAPQFGNTWTCTLEADPEYAKVAVQFPEVSQQVLDQAAARQLAG
ncbi:MAG TPA: hypothetical protein VHC69_33150 [Polyangiaceae bacterium]|nr:hypothetical protein [Polyangiaceae bacterium]